jgi:hypothetical protein
MTRYLHQDRSEAVAVFLNRPDARSRSSFAWRSDLAAHAIRTGLVDEYQLLVVPPMLGGGTRVLPSNVRIRLDLLTSAVLPMEWSIFATKRKPDGGCPRRF